MIAAMSEIGINAKSRTLSSNIFTWKITTSRKNRHRSLEPERDGGETGSIAAILSSSFDLCHTVIFSAFQSSASQPTGCRTLPEDLFQMSPHRHHVRPLQKSFSL